MGFLLAGKPPLLGARLGLEARDLPDELLFALRKGGTLQTAQPAQPPF